MKGPRVFGSGILVVAALASFGLLSSTAEAAPDVLEASITAGLLGSNSNIDVRVGDLSEAGLGAWTVDVRHDGSVVEFVSCFAQNGSTCGPQFGPEETRITGKSATGIHESDATLATLTYRCISVGTSLIELDVVVLSNANGGKLKPLDVIDGRIDCSGGDPVPGGTPVATTAPFSLPPSGGGPSTGGRAWHWAFAILSATGASLIGIAALRRERVP